MLAQLVCLDFVCGACGHPVGVTLRCEGIGLATPNPVAQVKVPCPTCRAVNRVCFSPDGTVLRVERERGRRRLPEPCPN